MESRYRVGDKVEYKYSGSFRKDPLFLREEVISKQGNLLGILVELRGRGVNRNWKQFVTDTPENRRANRVDLLVEIKNGKEIPLENKDNQDLFRQYEGTYVIPEGPAEVRKTVHRTIEVCQEKVKVICEVGTQKVANRVMDFENCESPDFLWGHVSAQYSIGSHVYYQAEVLACR